MEYDTIDEKFIILEKKGHGGTAKVFLVKEKDSEGVNVAKVLKEKKLKSHQINILWMKLIF